jgi:hypothetical protein
MYLYVNRHKYLFLWKLMPNLYGSFWNVFDFVFLIRDVKLVVLQLFVYRVDWLRELIQVGWCVSLACPIPSPSCLPFLPPSFPPFLSSFLGAGNGIQSPKMLDKCSTTELHPNSYLPLLILTPPFLEAPSLQQVPSVLRLPWVPL